MRNHIVDKIMVEYPILFNIELILIMLAVSLPIKKNNYNRKDKSLTYSLRGIAIIGIIIHHLTRHILNNPNGYPLFYDLGYLGVGVFLFLSGYGNVKSYNINKLKNYWEKKFVKIFLPYVFFVTIIIMGNFFIWGVKESYIKAIMQMVGMFNIIGEYWYVPYLILCYLIFYLIMRLDIDNNLKIYLFIFSSVIFLLQDGLGNAEFNVFSFQFGAIFAIKEDRIKEILQVKFKKNMKLNICVLIIGVVTNLMSKRLSEGKISLVIYVILIFSIIKILKFYKHKHVFLVIVMLLGSLFQLSVFKQSDSLCISISSLCFLIVIINIFFINKVRYISKGYEFLGKISYELYLSHFIFMKLFDFILYRFDIIVTFPIYLIFIVLLSFILNYIFKKLTFFLMKGIDL